MRLLLKLLPLLLAQKEIKGTVVVALLLEQLYHVHLFAHKPTGFSLGYFCAALFTTDKWRGHPRKQISHQVWPAASYKGRCITLDLLLWLLHLV